MNESFIIFIAWIILISLIFLITAKGREKKARNKMENKPSHELESNRENFKVIKKQRLENGKKVIILRDYYNEELVGKTGIIKSSDWDWPNWKYSIETDLGRYSSWDCDIKEIK